MGIKSTFIYVCVCTCVSGSVHALFIEVRRGCWYPFYVTLYSFLRQGHSTNQGLAFLNWAGSPRSPSNPPVSLSLEMAKEKFSAGFWPSWPLFSPSCWHLLSFHRTLCGAQSSTDSWVLLGEV